jgi:hypothetical protein
MIIHSLSFYYYSLPTSDNNYISALIDIFINEDISTLQYTYNYYQWPIFFIFSKVAAIYSGIELRIFSFILYAIFGILTATYIYNYVDKKGHDGYIGVSAFIFIIYWFFNYQAVPYSLSIILLLYIIYLDNKEISNTTIGRTLIIISYIVLAFTHMITSVLFIIYLLFNYYLSKDNKYKFLLITTTLLYLGIQIYSNLFPYYLAKILVINLGEFERRVSLTTATTIASAPFLSDLSQALSRITTILTWILSIIALVYNHLRKKLNHSDYSMILTSLLFTPFLFIRFEGYSQSFYRSAPLFVIVLSYCVSTLFLNEHKKKVKIIFFFLTILFLSPIIHQTFNDRQMFFISEKTVDMNTFYSDNFPNNFFGQRTFSDRRNMISLRIKSGVQARYYYPTSNFTNNLDKYTNILHTMALAKNFLRAGVPINELHTSFDELRFNVVYDSGTYNRIYIRERERD